MAPSKIEEIEAAQLRTGLPEFRVGDTVRVHYKIVEGDKDRIQVFQGVVTKRHRAGARSTFTVRKVSFNVGVERVFLAHSPRIDKVDRRGGVLLSLLLPPPAPLLLAGSGRQGRPRAGPKGQLNRSKIPPAHS
jgi:ribosomal protein L19